MKKQNVLRACERHVGGSIEAASAIIRNCNVIHFQGSLLLYISTAYPGSNPAKSGSGASRALDWTAVVSKNMSAGARTVTAISQWKRKLEDIQLTAMGNPKINKMVKYLEGKKKYYFPACRYEGQAGVFLPDYI
jgi:hypothetical protein